MFFIVSASHWRSAVELRPDDVKAWTSLGDAWMRLGNPDEAISAYRGAVTTPC